MPAKNPWNNRSAAFAVFISFLLGLIGALALRSSDAQQEAVSSDAVGQSRIHWRVPVAFSTNLPALGDNILYVAAALEQASNGRVVLEVFEPGMLIPPFSITEGVRDNKIEAGYTWLGYDQGRIAATPLISAVPFGMEPWEFTAWYFEDEGRALTDALYHPHNVHPILCGVIGPETAGWFRDRIESLDDFRGLKIRFAGLGGKVMQKLGASVTMLPGGEIFQALEKGAIDATEFSLPAVDQMLGFDKVAKFNYFPGWHQTFTAAHLVVNLQTWRALGDADRTFIEMACTAGVIRNLSRGEGIQGGVMQGFPDKGVTPVKFSEDILRQLEKLTNEVLQEEANKDEDFLRIWQSQKRFLATYQHWKSHAYLPRDFQANRSSEGE
ncbi:MAG: TRAP transporter substrate-binding protein [Pseudomonadales bacterium]|jgi:TRAP-type mannitol/chloroaromatic compound transport system substrate-binding protein|nr:TRAP transporter substrate-binding protein [Pseudomonadales bacterium]|tara:strand:+ start:2937 stop:4082 length:1146 start_codon:yes stop_codon:yes gene_type:complete